MQRRATRLASYCVALWSGFVFSACAEAIEPSDWVEQGGRAQDPGGGAGSPSRGGASAAGGATTNSGNGGSIARGGSIVASGGSSSGGFTSSGGAPGTGGTLGTAGSTATGGNGAKGGGVGASGGSTGKAGEQIFLDDFEDGNSEGWIPADTYGMWSVMTQAPSLSYVVTASGGKTMSVGGDSSWVDQLVESKVKLVSTGGSPVIRIMGRWKALKSFLVLEFRPGDASDPEGDMKLRQTLDGGTTDLCRYKPSSALGSEWNTIGFAVKGNVATIYFDGAPVVADKVCSVGAELNSGGVALGMEAGTAAFDDVRVSIPR
jgi:hypothetical protein